MFPFYANDTINSVKVLIDISNSSVGAEVILRILDSTSFRDQLFNNAIFTSNLYVVTASDIAQGFIEIPVGTQVSSGFQSLPIQAGSYYTALEMNSLGNTYDIAIIDDKTVGQPAWSSAIFIPNAQNYTNGNAFAIRVNLGDSSYSNCSNTFSTDNQNVCGSFTWIDGNTYTNSNNTATYTLLNAAGCDSIITLNLTLNQNPVGTDFSVNQSLFTTTPFIAQFTNTTPNISNYNFTWNFGDGTILQSNNLNVFHDFIYNGLYDVTLIAENINTGCTDTMYKQDYIFCTGNSSCVNASVDNQIACGSFTWIDGNTYTNSNNTATYTLVNASGCDSIITLNLIVDLNCCDSTIYIIDTLNTVVCDIQFQNISPQTYLAYSDTFPQFSNSNCDSIVSTYRKFIYNPNYCTDTILIYDTTTIFDTVNINILDTSYVSISVTDTLYINITTTGMTSIDNTITVYPNPANDVVIIDNGNYSIMNNYNLMIFNSLSQQVFFSTINIQQFQIPVSTLGSSGTYVIQIFDSSNNLIKTKYLILN